MSQYITGTVNMTNNDANVVGVGTAWLTEATADDLFIIQLESVAYTIDSISTDLALVLTVPYAGPTDTDVPYIIHRDFTTIRELPIMEQTSLGSVALYNVLALAVDAI